MHAKHVGAVRVGGRCVGGGGACGEGVGGSSHVPRMFRCTVTYTIIICSALEQDDKKTRRIFCNFPTFHLAIPKVLFYSVE